jgi:hypothetical protein
VTYRGNPLAGMDADTLARSQAATANLAGIVAGRRAAAAKLVPASTAPAQAVHDAWEPLRQAARGVPNQALGAAPVAPVPSVPLQIIQGNTTWTGEGPPDLDAAEYQVGDWYLDELTGDLYQLGVE